MPIDYDELDKLKFEQGYDDTFLKLGSVYVPGEGDNPLAFIVGEAPGAQEHMKARPFVGPSGVVLRDLMHSAGLHTGEFNYQGNEPNCWLTNVVKFRPPKNRNPTPAEIACARPYLSREWVAVGSPRLVIPVGGIALRAIMGRPMSILMLAGKPMMQAARDGSTIYVYPMIHPSFGLRNEQVRPLMERDWAALGEWIKNTKGLV